MLKYILEGLAVAAAAHVISGGRRGLQDIVILGLTAAAAFLILDLWAPGVSLGARQGSGFAIGSQMVGFGAGSTAPPLSSEVAAVEGYGEVGPKVGPIVPPAVAPVPLVPDVAPSQAAQAIQQTDAAHKLVAGEYSAKVLLAGYNENSEAYNASETADLHSWPFADDNRPPGL